MSETEGRVDRIALANAELAAEENLWESMKEQARSMFSMALMFVTTIGLGIYLLPFYSAAELQAFGKEGASQVRFILLEFVAILLFTALIIFLARYKKEWILKYGLLFVIWIALSYTTIPIAHYALAPSSDPALLSWNESAGNDELFTSDLGNGYWITTTSGPLWQNDDGSVTSTNNITLRNGADGDIVWTNTTAADGQREKPWVTSDGEYLTMTDGRYWWMHDPATGEIQNEVRDCPQILTGPECRVAIYNDGDQLTITSENTIVLLDSYHNSTMGTLSVDSKHRLVEGLIVAKHIGEDKLFLMSETFASIFIIPEEFPSISGSNRNFEMVDVVWNMSAPEGAKFTSMDFGFSPNAEVVNENNSGEVMLLAIGTDAGDVFGFEVNTTIGGGVVNAEWMVLANNGAVEGAIQAIRLADWNGGGLNDLFILDSNGLQMFSGNSLVHLLLDDSAIEGAMILLKTDTQISEDAEYQSTLAVIGTESTTEASLGSENLARGFMLYDIPFLLGLIVSTLILILLIKHPEWYVVNTAGIIMGAGVVTMLGISFVPWLIIIFMVAAAGYDAWAVYKSKHMLELADTMINLKLPILLVAPQEKGYSMLDEGDDRLRKSEAVAEERASLAKEQARENAADKIVEAAKSEASAGESGFKAKANAANAVQNPKRKKESSKDAMFMGLGDVIFPGMLVISAITWLAAIGGEEAAFMVGMGTMLGGLVGYFALMTYVARGRPQAGLPLLNGGSIIGFLISSMIFIGSKALEFNISF